MKCICGKDYKYVKWGGGESAFCEKCELKVKGFFLAIIIIGVILVLFLK